MKGKVLFQSRLKALVKEVKTKEVAQTPPPSPPSQPPQEERTPPTKTLIYEETAQKGEGITHLARRALKRYLTERGINLTPEQKLYAEDYIQKKTGNYWLKLGEKLTFSQDLIEEAIQKAQSLSPEALKNLTKFVKLVPALNY